MRFWTTGGAILIWLALLVQLQPVLINIPTVNTGQLLSISEQTTRGLREPVAQLANFAAEDKTNQYHSLVFVGDILLARHVEVLMNQNGQGYPFAGLQVASLADRPAVVGNFESAIPPEHVRTPAYTLRFSTPTSSLSALVDAGYTHLSIANNHSQDFGLPGLVHTIEALTDATLIPFGEQAAVPYDSVSYIETPYGRTALIGLDDSGLQLNQAAAIAAIDKAALRSDLQIVYIHWGIEYDLTSSPRQQTVAEWLVAAGADLIIGHHPHVVQEVGLIEGVPVFYSLGNYIFDQYFSAEVQTGLVVVLALKPEPTLELVPVESLSSFAQPRPLAGDAKAVFLYQLATRSAKEVQPYIQRGAIPLTDPFATASKIAMITE